MSGCFVAEFILSDEPPVKPGEGLLAMTEWAVGLYVDILQQSAGLFIVLKGDIGLVGPGLHPIDNFRRYTLERYRRPDVKPDMTSL